MKSIDKVKVGNVLYLLAIAVLVVYVVVVLLTSNLPTKRVTCLFIAAAVFISTLSSLLTGEVGIRGYGSVKRSERAGLYWSIFILQCLMGGASLVLAFLA